MASLPPQSPVRRSRSPSSSPAIKDWVTQVTTENQINLQQQIVTVLLRAYGGLLVTAVGAFYLQGFNAWGFHLDDKLMMWLGGATIGAIAGFITLSLKGVFKKNTST